MTTPFSNTPNEPSEDDLQGLGREAAPWSSYSSPTARREIPRPSTVTTALVIMWVSVALGVLAILLTFGALGAIPSGQSPEVEALRSAAIIMLVVAAALLVLQIIATLKAGQGRKWARIVLVVLVAVDIVMKLFQIGQQPTGIIGIALGVLVIVLLFRPASNEWFDSKN